MRFRLYEGRRIVPHTKAEMGVPKKEPETKSESTKDIMLPKGLIINFAYTGNHMAFMLNAPGDAYVPILMRSNSGMDITPLENNEKYIALSNTESTPVGIYGYAEAPMVTEFPYGNSYEHYSKNAIFTGHGEIIFRPDNRIDVKLFSTKIPQERSPQLQTLFFAHGTVAETYMSIGKALTELLEEYYIQEEK